MFIDALTIAGLLSAASFSLMPLLMGREFIQVEISEETESRPTRLEAPVQPPLQTAPMGQFSKL
jgi:hypothetical protein